MGKNPKFPYKYSNTSSHTFHFPTLYSLKLPCFSFPTPKTESPLFSLFNDLSMSSKTPLHPDSTPADKSNDGGSPPSEDRCSVEEVALVVPETDDPSLPVMTFRSWVLGLTSCCILIFLNTFFTYRSQPLAISAILMQISVLPIGRFMASTLPNRDFHFLHWKFSLNPGPFNMKEHVIITIFANCGISYGGGDAYSIGAITVMKAYYKQSLSFLLALLIVLTTQVLGYGWAGMLRRYLVDPVEMWWPANLAQVSLFRYDFFIFVQI